MSYTYNTGTGITGIMIAIIALIVFIAIDNVRIVILAAGSIMMPLPRSAHVRPVLCSECCQYRRQRIHRHRE